MKITNVEELNKAIKENLYHVEYFKPKYLKEDTIIDEDKSVRWNREQVEQLNLEMKIKAKQNKQERKDMQLKQQKDIVRAYANQANLSEQKIKLILDYAYEESHSYGIQAVLETLDSLIDLIKKIEDL